jgi:LmbE family N-acetylglucosaminyl deacetylase
MKHAALLIIIAMISACSGSKVDYKKIAAFQDNSVPELTMDISDTTRVLAIFPHADDETIAGGLILYLKQKGAAIHLLTLCEHNEMRMNELNCSAEKLGIENVEVSGFVNNSWEDIMNNNISFWYDNKDSIKQTITNKIQQFKPHILITYDSEIGGYGHPEHLVSAELTEDIFLENSKNPGFTPEYLLQITLTDELENFLVASSPAYEPMLKKQNSSGLPAPNAALDIRSFWPQKNEAAYCHTSQFKTLKKFYILYDKKATEKHQLAFSHEYYKVITR